MDCPLPSSPFVAGIGSEAALQNLHGALFGKAPRRSNSLLKSSERHRSRRRIRRRNSSGISTFCQPPYVGGCFFNGLLNIIV